jgi:hypothetical protein
MQRGAVYSRKGSFLLHAWSKTTAGVWIASDPYLVLEENNGDSELGAAVCSVLDGSHGDVAHPATWSGLFDPMLRLAKVRSYGSFVKGARYVVVARERGNTSVTPTKNLGLAEGFEDDIASSVEVDSSHVEALGAQARAALRNAR